ncbi:MAG: hypothetical protein DRJ10_13125, partial [Bacteroidetes bacterium]
MNFKNLILLFVPFYFSFVQIGSNDQFQQEVATVFTLEDGLPEIAFSDIQLDKSGNILAVSKEGVYKYNGEKWRLFSKTSDLLKTKTTFDDKNVLTKVEFNQNIYTGKKTGLFIKDRKNNNDQEIFPADKKYSWKLTGVNTLLVDSKKRLWFG